jgi:hypothetical protein
MDVVGLEVGAFRRKLHKFYPVSVYSRDRNGTVKRGSNAHAMISDII